MKKIYFIAASALLVLCATSCKKNTDIQESESKGDKVKVVFSASSKEGSLRTSVSGSSVLWSSGDKIKLYAGSTSGGAEAGDDFTLTSGAGTTEGIFEGFLSSEATAPYVAVYPSSAVSYCSGSSITFNIPVTQPYVENSISNGAAPMVAYSVEGKALEFKNQCAFIKFQLTGEGTITTMEVSSSSKEISGEVSVSRTNPTAALNTSYGDRLVNVTFDNVKLDPVTPKNVIVAIAPNTFAENDITISIGNGDGLYFVKFTGGFSLGRSTGRTIIVDNIAFEEIKPVYGADLTDQCGKTYKTVVIGDQTWMAKNLECNQYASESTAYNASWLTNNTLPTEYSANPKYEPGYKDGTASGFGYYYTWAAVVGLEDGKTQKEPFVGNRQGICPNGWHVPTNNEWEMLRKYVNARGGSSSPISGQHLKSTSGWKDSSNQELPQYQGQDLYGFSALPQGYYYGDRVGQLSRFWTADPTSYASYKETRAQGRGFQYNSNDMSGENEGKMVNRPIRCIKNK